LKNYYKKTILNVDENKVAEYFPLQHTIDALLAIYQDFFNLEFKQLPVKGLWDPEVKLIEVIDKAENQTMGYLLLDLYPRPGKYTHAAQQVIVPALYLSDGKQNLSLMFVIANFPKPTAEKPSLLKLRDVTTFFHEFGHAIHSFFARTSLASHSGTHAVKRDFVEMPSQMLEEWMRDYEILKMVSHHYRTGEKLPDDLIEALLKMRTFDTGFFVSRQLFLANFALDCFNNGPSVDLEALRKKLFDKLINGIQYNPEDHFYASFGHLVGYGARYYGYLWSEVFAHDLFGVIKQEGLLNPAVGRRYAEKVLSKGGSRDPNDLLKDFLGRQPNQNEYMKAMGF
jgi:thimet oligopeptidase